MVSVLSCGWVEFFRQTLKGSFIPKISAWDWCFLSLEDTGAMNCLIVFRGENSEKCGCLTERLQFSERSNSDAAPRKRIGLPSNSKGCEKCISKAGISHV